MTPSEIGRVQTYMRQAFDNMRIRLMARKGQSDSVEVLLGEEFIGVIYKDEDEGEISYQFQMAILEEDLPDIA